MEPASIIRKWGLPVALLCGLVGFFASGLHDLVSWQTVTLHYAKINHFTQQNWLASYAGFANPACLKLCRKNCVHMSKLCLRQISQRCRKGLKPVSNPP